MERIDVYPTHNYGEYKLRIGRPQPFGASLVPSGVNFSIFSSYATSCTLVLFKKHALEPFAEIPFPDAFRIGNVYSMTVFDLDYEDLEYGYRMEGPNSFQEGHWFDPKKIVMDPYAKVIG
ncbi:MAG: glycogen debranching enzyme, partial [Microcystaceae cyanobacterium]